MWMSLEIIILSEIRQREIQLPYDVMSMWNLKCGTRETIYETEKELRTERTDWWLSRGRDGLGVWDQKMQTIIYRMNKQQFPNVQHRELYLISYGKV